MLTLNLDDFGNGVHFLLLYIKRLHVWVLILVLIITIQDPVYIGGMLVIVLDSTGHFALKICVDLKRSFGLAVTVVFKSSLNL